MLEMSTLEWLVHPVTAAEFARDYWEQKPLIIHRTLPDYYRDLLSLESVDEILSASGIHGPYIRVVRKDGGKNDPPRNGRGVFERANATEELFAELRQGSTLVLQSLQEGWPPLRRLCQSLATEFSAAFQVNVYLTPASARGLMPHYDTHDVFVLQIHGTKHWRIFDQAMYLPLPVQVHNNEFRDRDDPTQEFDLRPGDAIYIPRGWGHVAETRKDVSLHLTVGVHPMTWAMVALQAIEEVVAHEPRFRESLPLGFAREDAARGAAVSALQTRLEVLKDRLDPEAIIDRAAQQATLGRQPALKGQLLDLVRARDLDEQTPLRRREGVESRLTTNGPLLELAFHGKAMQFPPQAERELRFIADSQEVFHPSTLPGSLDPESRVLLARRLVNEGFLTVCASQPPPLADI